MFFDVLYLMTLSLARVIWYQMLEDNIRIVKLKDYGKKGLWPNSKYCTDIRMENLRACKENLNHSIQYTGQNSSPDSIKHRIEMLTLHSDIRRCCWGFFEGRGREVTVWMQYVFRLHGAESSISICCRDVIKIHGGKQNYFECSLSPVPLPPPQFPYGLPSYSALTSVFRNCLRQGRTSSFRSFRHCC
jgi:hypothetical protein